MKVKFKKKTTYVDRRSTILRGICIGVLGVLLMGVTSSSHPPKWIYANNINEEVTTETEEDTSSEDEIMESNYDFDWDKTKEISVQAKKLTASVSNLTMNLLDLQPLEHSPINTLTRETEQTFDLGALYQETQKDLELEHEESKPEETKEILENVVSENPNPDTIIKEEEKTEQPDVLTVQNSHMPKEQPLEVEDNASKKDPMSKSEPYINITAEEREILCRITEAEVTGTASELAGWKGCSEDEIIMSKFNVARVIVNRVLSDKFPNTVKGVVFQNRQFSPISDGRYWSVKITSDTRKAVDMALDKSVQTEVSDALFFRADKGTWKSYEYMFKDKAGHKFYRIR